MRVSLGELVEMNSGTKGLILVRNQSTNEPIKDPHSFRFDDRGGGDDHGNDDDGDHADAQARLRFCFVCLCCLGTLSLLVVRCSLRWVSFVWIHWESWKLDAHRLQNGGAILVNSQSSVNISGALLGHNRAGRRGGAMAVFHSMCDLYSSQAWANNATTFGGAVYMEHSSGEVVNVSFVENTVTSNR